MYTKFENNPSRGFWVIALTPLRAAGGGRLRRKTITSPDPSDMGDIMIGHLFNATWSFVHHFIAIGDSKLEIQSGNAQFWSKSTIFRAVWPWKTIGHLFYATSSFVHHFVAISDFKLELQSGNAPFGSNSTIFWAAWPWNLTDDLQKQ